MSTVLITGAASGIGLAAARCFAAEGWRCELVDRDGAALQALHTQLPGDHHWHCVDLTVPAQIRHLGLSAQAAATAPLIDAVINNAGMSDPSGIPLVEQTPQQQATLRALNLDAPAAVVEALAPRLAPGARIVNVASGAGLRAIPLRGYYSSTKAGLIAQSKALAAARPDLVVTVLCPGFVRTDLVDALIAAQRLDPRQAVAKTPLGRMAEPTEMARMLFFLASRDAVVIRGGVVSLCGGSSVYGGSGAHAVARRQPLPLDTRLSMRVVGDAQHAWHSAEHLPDASHAYPAVVDASTLDAGGTGGLIDAVHAATIRFAQSHATDASLTLLLPADDARSAPWQSAGTAAAARMLVSTLACELAARALRVNAIEVAPGLAPGVLVPLLHMVGGAQSQYLTGQTLQTVAPAA